MYRLCRTCGCIALCYRANLDRRENTLLSSSHSFTHLLSRVRDVWPFVQLFVHNVSSTELTLNEFGSCTVISNWQPYVTEEQLPTDWRRRVSVQVQRRQSGHRQRPSGHHNVAVQNKGDAAQPVVDTAAEPFNLPPGHLAVSPNRRRRRGIIPHRYASLCCACCSALGDCFIFLYVRPLSVATLFRYFVLVPIVFSILLGQLAL